MELKTGKRPATYDQRDLLFVHYGVSTGLPTPPTRFGHGDAFRDWLMLGNDYVGDCVLAGGDHETMLFTKLGGKPAKFTRETALGDYSAITGYNPNDPSTDQGTYTRDAMRYRQNTGLVDANGVRHKIGAYVALQPGDWTHLMQALYIFGAVGIGFEVPESCFAQFDAGQPWSVVPGAQIEGGHYVSAVGRPSPNVVTVVTWGRKQKMTRGFYEKYADEAWAFVSEEQLRSGKTEHGFNLAQLNQDLLAVRG